MLDCSRTFPDNVQGQEEIWKDIVGYIGCYQVSNWGRVQSLERKARLAGGHFRKVRSRILKPAISKTTSNGYPQVQLSREGKTVSRDIHRLVLEAFIGPCPAGMECCHLDGDRTNCRLENLCWGTFSKNQKDRSAHGTSNQGERNNRAKLNESQVRSIRSMFASGKYTQTRLGEIFGVTNSIVCEIVNRKIWRHI